MPQSFTDKFVEFTRESETPTSFWKWGSYAIIAGVLRDNVYWHYRGNKVCCNIYVLLNADSGTHRKSMPVREADKLLNVVKNTKVIRGRGSIQAVLEELSRGSMDKETGKTTRGGSCLLVADELKSFFVGDDSLIGILTDIYDYKDNFDYRLRSSSFQIKNLCVSMLAASNDEFLKTIYTGEAVFGGLLGRTFIVKPDEYRPGISLLELEGEEDADLLKYDVKPLTDMLICMSKLAGKVRFTREAKATYDEWYYELRKTYEKRPDRTGVLSRLHAGVVKIAVILAVSRRLELIVRECDVEDAISDCMGLMPNYDEFAINVGKTPEAVVGGLLMSELMANGGQITRAEFLTRHWFEASNKQLDELVASLEVAGMLSRGFNGTNSDVFVMTDKCKEIMRRSDVK